MTPLRIQDETPSDRSQSVWDALRKLRRQSPDSNTRPTWSALAFGQFLAFTSASMGASSYALTATYNVNTQLFQLFWMYIFLSLHMFFRNVDALENTYSMPFTRIRLRIQWWIYLGVSVLDVLPNFMQLLSLRYTSLTSTTLLGSLTVPSTMLFSKYILARVFGVPHYIGVILCVVGGMLTIWADQGNDASSSFEGDGDTKQSIMGDCLAIFAAVCYGLGDTVAEYAIKHIDRNEYLGMLGFFGVIQTGVAFPFIEGNEIRNLVHRSDAGFISVIFVFYVGVVLVYYLAEASFLVSSDATLLNLSLQGANLWAIFFSVVAYQETPPLVFYLAALLVVTGVFVYQLRGSVVVHEAVPLRDEDEEGEESLSLTDDAQSSSSYDSL